MGMEENCDAGWAGVMTVLGEQYLAGTLLVGFEGYVLKCLIQNFEALSVKLNQNGYLLRLIKSFVQLFL